MMRTMAASMAIERSSWITSESINARHLLTFLVHFLKDWRREYDPVDFANKRLIDPDDGIVPELLLSGCLLSSSRIIPHLEQVVPLEHETLDILGAGLIINFHDFFDLFDSQLVALQGFVVEEHDQGHLDGAQHEIVVTGREFGTDSGTAQGITPFQQSVIILRLIVVLEMAHPGLKLSWHLHLLECLVSWPVARGQNSNLEVKIWSLFLFL